MGRRIRRDSGCRFWNESDNSGRAVPTNVEPCFGHIRNKIEGINRSRGEAGETIHHLFIAKLKGYIESPVYSSYRSGYKECIRVLNGLEKSLEKHLPESERRWTTQGGSSLLNSEPLNTRIT
jgi:four helix bundle protein